MTIRLVFVPMLQRVTLCFMTLAILALSVVHIGEKAETSPFARLFTNPDGSPCEKACILGVLPGHTSFESALEILR